MMTSKSKTRKPVRYALLVLGMHRSGTSALAGVLSELGCDLPTKEMEPTQDNERGYFESRKIHALHNNLLESAGNSWDSWSEVNPDWYDSPRMSEYLDKAAETLAHEYGTSPLFVLKDPRICRLMPFWQEVLETANCTPLVIHTHRNPLQVVKSLSQRDGLLPELSLLIWLRHVVDAEHGSRGMARFFTSYDSLLTSWSAVATGLQAQLNIKLPKSTDRTAEKVDAFLSSDLRHHHQTPEQVLENTMISGWVREAYNILERWVAEGENPKDHATFDQIREGLNEAGAIFGVITEKSQALQHSLLQKQGADQERDETTQAELQALQDEVARTADLEVEVASLTNELHETRSALKQRRHEADDVGRALREAEVALAGSAGKIDAMADQLRSTEAQLQTRFTELTNLTTVLIRKEDEIAGQQRQLSELQNMLLAQQEKLTQATDEIHVLRSSTSWALTAPLRGLGRLVGKK